MKILVTGAAGFIGFHLIKRLVDEGHVVIGLDSINDYYDVNLKYGRLDESGIDKDAISYNKEIKSNKLNNYKFYKLKIEDKENIKALFEKEKFDAVCNLAAQAGVRYSIENPDSYIEANVVGFLNILECCRYNKIKHLVYASSSSVYGANEKLPFSTSDNVDHPISIYAASKKSNELMAHTYSYLYDIPTTGLRFFTVYGPWGRPDMALFLFAKAMFEDKEIKVYNNGNMQRDFTYISDIVEGIVRVIGTPPKKNNNWSGESPDPSSSKAAYKIYNIGNSSPVKLMDFIDAIEKNIGKTAKKNMMPIQPGDVLATFADVSDLQNDLGYKPNTTIQEGVKNFIDWYKSFYRINE